VVDFSVLTDAVIGCQQSNAQLLALLPTNGVYADPAMRIFPYYAQDPNGTNIEQRIQTQPMDTIMIGWTGTRLGRFLREPATRHEFVAYLKNSGKASDYITAFIDGMVNWNSQQARFRFTTIHDKTFPPEDLAASRVSLLIGQNFMLYDSIQIAFALSERGVDN
jgi:hypothetical protein